MVDSRQLVRRFLRVCCWTALASLSSLGTPSSSAFAQESVGGNEIHSQLDGIYSDPTLRGYRGEQGRTVDEESFLERWFDSEGSDTRESSSSSIGWSLFFGQFLGYVIWIVLFGALAAVLVIVAVRLFRSGSVPTELEEASASEDVSILESGDEERAPEEFLRRAETLHQEGRVAEAIAHVLFACQRQLEACGFLRFRRGLTNRDYIRSLRSQESARVALTQIVTVFEAIHFGRRLPPEDAFPFCRDLYHERMENLGQA